MDSNKDEEVGRQAVKCKKNASLLGIEFVVRGARTKVVVRWHRIY